MGLPSLTPQVFVIISSILFLIGWGLVVRGWPAIEAWFEREFLTGAELPREKQYPLT